MEFLLHSESDDEAKPFVTTVPIKGEPVYETEDSTGPIACRPDLYDVHVKVEPLENLDIEVANLSEGTIKKESIAIVDAEFEATEDSNIVTSHGSQIEVCITKESCSSPTLEDIVINKDFLKCRICQKIFDNNSSLARHMFTHDRDKSTTKKKRKQSKEIITCKICRMQFTSSHPYCKHRQTHFEKPFKCEFCEKAFNSKYLLTNHERTHTGEKPFSCDLCGKRFTEKVNLNRHKRSHAGAKLYRCNVCSKSFTCKQNLDAHMICSHTDEKQWEFECQFCNKRWPNKSELRRHLRTHTGERPYSCDICKKSFNRKYYLVPHIRAHNNERPFPCEICNKRFVDKQDCKKHLKIHMTKKK